MLKDSNTIADVVSKADPINKEAVDWWLEQWAQHYPQLSDVSLNVYNTILDKDGNYTPDFFNKLKEKSEKEELQITSSAFAQTTQKVYDKKTGVLMEATRPKSLPKDRYISLDFDTNNQQALDAALVDINTAASTQQIKGFVESDAFNKLVPNSEDRTLLRDRVYRYIKIKRGKDFVKPDEMSQLQKFVNFIASLGVTRVLGGITQPLKQTVPVAMNTLINAGRLDLTMPFNPEINAWINNSGYGIANRGITSQTTLERINKAIEKAAESRGAKALKSLEGLNNFWLQQFLVKPDVYIARASFMSYYLQNLSKQGKDTKNIDWKTHKVDTKAADYAQRMVDRQQNVPDGS